MFTTSSARPPARYLLGLALFSGAWGAGHASVAQASTPSDYLTEIITPEGWELRSDRCNWRDVSSSKELITPEGWELRAGGDEPSWGGCVCSELVTPVEWHKATSQR